MGGAVEEGGGLAMCATCDLWKSAMNNEYFSCTVQWVQDKVGGGLKLKRRVVTTCKVLAETISTTTE